jgi:elongation factor Ts
MDISAKQVMDLRKKTNAGMMDCKKALKECNGDMEAAIKYLREKGISKAAKKAERATKEGRVHAYIHGNGSIGVLLEVNCETDFVAQNDMFIDLCKDLSMQIAASNPLAVSREDLDKKNIDDEREILKNTALNEGKPEKIIDKIVDGQIEKYIKQSCLLEQEYIKDPDKTVNDIINEAIVALGENIQVSRFVRYSLGE